MKRFRMYLGTKDKFGSDVPSALQEQFFAEARESLHNFTVFPAIGAFRGEKEHTHVLEYYGDSIERGKVDALAHRYVQLANQESVLVTSEHIAAEDISLIEQVTEVA